MLPVNENLILMEKKINKMDVSIIIVNYNTIGLTRNCLKSVFEQTKDIAFEVIVSDNGSTDGSVEMIKSEFPQVNLIENNENLGFGAANNRGLAIAKGKYIFYLNSDTILLNNAVKMFFDYWENTTEKNSIGAIGCNLLNSDMSINSSFGCFPTYRSLLGKHFRHIASAYLKPAVSFILGKKNFSKPLCFFLGDVDYITGAALFLQNNNDSFFDESFFMYFEETDLQFQLAKKGLRRVLIAGPKIIHLDGGSFVLEKKSFYDFTARRNLISNESSVLYLKKNDINHRHYQYLKFALLLIYWLPWNLFQTSTFRKRLKEL